MMPQLLCGSLSDAAPQCYNDSANCVTLLWDKNFSLMQSTERLVSVMTGTRERCIRLKWEGETQWKDTKHEGSNDGITIESSRFPSALVSSPWVPFSTMSALSASVASCAYETIRFKNKRLTVTPSITSQSSQSLCNSGQIVSTYLTVKIKTWQILEKSEIWLSICWGVR